MGTNLESQQRGFDVARAETRIAQADCSWLGAIHYFEQIGSTNQFLLAQHGSVHGQSCVTDFQTQGRGRRGRTWVGAKANIALSMGWEPERAVSPALSLVVGVAVVETLQAHGVAEASLKWPNDILAGKQKLGGVLVESVHDAQRSKVVIGVGINVDLATADNHQIEQAWTDLKQLGYDQLENGSGRTDLVADLIVSIALNLQEFEQSGMAPFRARWQRLHHFERQVVEFSQGEQLYHGEIAGIANDGALMMRIAGQLRTFVAGEIKLKL